MLLGRLLAGKFPGELIGVGFDSCPVFRQIDVNGQEDAHAAHSIRLPRFPRNRSSTGFAIVHGVLGELLFLGGSGERGQGGFAASSPSGLGFTEFSGTRRQAVYDAGSFSKSW